ncbi:MAG: MFS transporter [Candidatus Eremiobacteraeota bacterium]|nr:MFS transporter [Candidatus Eremiobacteraeota bacterium]
MTAASQGPLKQFSLAAYWFAWELHWAALLGATLQAEIARFMPPTEYGRATAVLGAVGAVLAIISQYAAGRASDFARKRLPFIVAGTLLDIVALYAFAVAPSFGAVVLSFAAIEIALNIAGGPYQALIPDRVAKSAQGRASAYMGLMRLAGTAAGLLLAKLVVHQPGPGVTPAMFTHSFLVLVSVISAALLVALAVTLLGVREQPGDVAPPVPVLEDWPNRASFWWLIISRASVSAGLYLILPFLGFYLRFALHVDRYQSASLSLLLLMVVCSLVGTAPAGVLGDRFSKKSIIYIALALLAGGALALTFITTLAPLTALAVALGIGWGAYYSVDWALATNLLPEGRAGALMAIWNLGASAPQVAAPIVGGLLVDRIGAATGDFGLGYRALFALVAGFVICGALALVFVRENREGVTRESS